MDEAQIQAFLNLLQDEKWTNREYRRDDETVWWKASYTLPRRRIEVYVGLQNGCVLLQLPMIVRTRPECQEAMWRYLLELNHNLKLVKFTLDREDKIHLSAQILAETCSYSGFRQMLFAMRSYFDYYQREIELLAANHQFAKAWLSLAKESTTEEEDLTGVSIIDEIREVVHD